DDAVGRKRKELVAGEGAERSAPSRSGASPLLVTDRYKPDRSAARAAAGCGRVAPDGWRAAVSRRRGLRGAEGGALGARGGARVRRRDRTRPALELPRAQAQGRQAPPPVTPF